jgi:hypothetical protein
MATFGDFADRPAQRASQCVFHFQSLGHYERLVQTSPPNRAAQKKLVYNLFAWITCGDMARFVANRCHMYGPSPDCKQIFDGRSGLLLCMRLLCEAMVLLRAMMESAPTFS